MDQLSSQLRELHALACEGILDAAEYVQLKAELMAGHRERQRSITAWHTHAHSTTPPASNILQAGS